MNSLSHSFDSEKIAVLGASRGLGRAFCEALSGTKCKFLLSSRKEKALQEIAIEEKELLPADFSKNEDQERVIDRLKSWSPDRIFYFAGGGPFGEFSQKRWKDHLWGIEVSFLFPAKVLHQVSSKQMVFVGSNIAEDQPDPKAATYAAAKHGLLGLLRSVNQEGIDTDLRLFSPGYMDTDMLPRNASVRKNGDVWPVEEVAERLIDWAKNANGEWHYKLKRKAFET